MKIHLFYFLFTIGLFASCGDAAPKADKEILLLEKEENKIINIIFEATVGHDTMWTRHLLVPIAYMTPPGTLQSKQERQNYLKQIDSLKVKLDSARLYVFLNDSIVKYPESRNAVKSMLKLNDFTANFPDIDTLFRPLLYKLVDSTQARELDISLIKTKFRYHLDYERNKTAYPTNIVTIGNVTISRVVFNRDKTKACVYSAFVCGGLCGGGRIFFLDKINGIWTIKGERMLWVS